MKLVPRDIHYYKRRLPDQKLTVVSASSSDLQLIDYSQCNLEVTLGCGTIHQVTGRVNKNDQSGKWSIATNIFGDNRLIVLDVIVD